MSENIKNSIREMLREYNCNLDKYGSDYALSVLLRCLEDLSDF